MTYLLSAWTPSNSDVYHEQHLNTIAAVLRLIELLVHQTHVRKITVRIIRQPASHQIPLYLSQ